MAAESIELLKNWAPEKMTFPAYHMEKLDGVPVRLVRRNDKVGALTRQNKLCTSIDHILEFYAREFPIGLELIGELYVRGFDFKDISGRVRTEKKVQRELVLYVFDAFSVSAPNASYKSRLRAADLLLAMCAARLNCGLDDLPIRLIPWTKVENADEAMSSHRRLMFSNPKCEGSVIHSADKVFSPGKRCWGTQRIKDAPTIDCLVTGFEEAYSEAGEPLGMVGRVNLQINRLDPATGAPRVTADACGPGKLLHGERRALWAMYKMGRYVPKIAEIKFMPDDSYEKLRQATFQRWRDDKTKGDVL